MKRIALLFLLACLVLTSCTREFVFQVFNNSGQDVVLTVYDGNSKPSERKIPTGTSRDVPFTKTLEIKHGGGAWRYDFVPVIDSYTSSKKPGPPTQKLQIEPDGSVYALTVQTNAPVKTFPPQPSAFPMKPLKN